MKLIQFQFKHTPAWGAFLEKDNLCLDFAQASGISDLRTYLNSSRRPSLSSLHKRCLEKRLLVPCERAKLTAPISPGTLFGVGFNLKETYRDQKNPVLFLKAVQSITGHSRKIVVPSFLKEVYAEVELAIVVGRRSSIFGYTVVNDITARGIDDQDIWFSRKSFSTFTPCGPWIVTRNEVKDHNHLDLLLTVNNRVKIKSNTAAMVFDPRQVIAALSRRLALLPGDVIMMGCPGLSEKLKPGDVVKAEIPGIGVLENTIARKTDEAG